MNGSEKNLKKPRIAVVVGSGGIKPMAAIPLFKFLDDSKIEIDAIFGCSGGAIVAAMRAMGYNAEEMNDLVATHLEKKLFSQVDYHTLLGIAKLPFVKFDRTRGILKPGRLIKVLKTIYQEKDFSQLKIPAFIQVTEVETGDGLLIDKGDIAEAVYASAAQFPFFPPIQIGGRWVVDGVYSSPLPVLEAVNKNYDIIIVVAIEQRTKLDTASFIEYCYQFVGRSYTSTQKKQMALAIDLHHHEIVIMNINFDEVIHMWDVEKLPVIMQSGAKVLEKRKDEILSAIESFYEKKR